MAKDVVIVDDPATRQILVRDSRRAGIEVAGAAADGVDAIAVAAPAFDLVLGDVDLANRNGPVRC